MSVANSPLLSLIFPRLCPACGTAHGPDSRLSAHALCPGCSENLQPVTAPFCESCGEPYPGAITSESFRCSNCTGRTFAFEFAISGYLAEGPARDIIHRFKYRKESHLAKPAAGLLAEALDDPRITGEDDWILVPVPLHWRRRNRRGYNQAEELCRQLSKATRLPVANVLRRNRSTGHQAHLDRAARLKNLEGSIRIRRFPSATKIKEKPVLLVDDVFTTGSTAHECAKVLKMAGARVVAVITVARG